jgi:flagellar protein FliO/FliZ
MKRLTYFFMICFTLIAFNHSVVQAEYVDECLEDPGLCEEEGNPATQEEETDDELLQEDSGGSLLFELIKLFFALLLVVGLIYAFLFFLKRNNRLGNKLTSLESVGGISLGQNKSVQLIRLGERLYIVGVGENITLLEEIQDKALIEEILKEKENQQANFQAGDLLNTLLPKKKKKEKDEFNQLFKKELTRLEKNRKAMINRHKEDKHE